MKKRKLFQILDKTIENITEDILSRFYASPMSFSELRRQMYGFQVGPKQIQTQRIYDSMRRLQQQGWIEKKTREDEIYYSLTAKGRVKQLVFKLRTSQKQKGEQSTILIFDIPEEKRSYRNFLRRLLKQMKFTTIQKSVLVAPYILPDEFYDLLKEMKLLGFVKVIEGHIRYN